MTLASRLSLFFLGTLAAVLVGFSLGLYGLARSHLNRQVHERLQAALAVLAAAAEIEPDGIDWEPHQRGLTLGSGEEVIRWLVTDSQGQPIDASSEEAYALRSPPVEGWRVWQRTLRATGGTAPAEAGAKRYPALTLTAAAPLGPVQANLRWLAVVLTGLSVGLWLSAALAGRWLCRRALRPLVEMAQTARGITAADLNRRLPSPVTGDELEDLGAEFNALLGRLHEAFERQRRFTGDASHQLRTPLTGLLGQIEVALRRPRDPQEYLRVLRSVQGQATQLRQIVAALLFLARADAEARAPEGEPIDLSAWLSRHLKSWSSHPRAADLRCAAAAGPLKVRTHTPLLGQALDNLLDNAFKYGAPGSPITVRTGEKKGYAYLSVEDRGAGIDAADLPHVFEPFYRSPRARHQGGVGLGLSVAARIAAALSGRIEVHSEPGRGSRFTLFLPTDTPEIAHP
jgi:heavy metal sensor kinase